jgi:hypothetical protein
LPRYNPIKKQPNIFIEIVPKGSMVGANLATHSLITYLDKAPIDPPIPINKKFI